MEQIKKLPTTPVREQELEAARTAGWGMGFRDQHEMMVKNGHYRERVFNEILELDSAMGLSRFTRTQEPAPAQPVAVPEAAQQNGGLVRAALIDLLSPEVERAANSGAISFECQSNIATIFARGRQALSQSAFDAAPAAQGDAKELTDDEIVQAVHSVGVDTHPSKFGFSEEQIEGMSVTVLRQVIAAIAAKAAS